MDAFVLMDCLDENYFESNQIQASFIAIRKSDFSVSFIEEWLKYCCDIRIISPNKNVMGKNNFNKFIAHREDQSVFSLLTKKYGILPHQDPTQYGRLIHKDYENKMIYNKNELKKEYPACIVLHRSRNLSFIVCLYHLLCAILPIKIASKLLSIGNKKLGIAYYLNSINNNVYVKIISLNFYVRDSRYKDIM